MICNNINVYDLSNNYENEMHEHQGHSPHPCQSQACLGVIHDQCYPRHPRWSWMCVLHHLCKHLGHPCHPRRSGMRPGVLHCCHRHSYGVRLNEYIRLNKYTD